MNSSQHNDEYNGFVSYKPEDLKSIESFEQETVWIK